MTDEQWAQVEHLFLKPSKCGAGRPRADPRAVLDAIFWIKAHDERWLHLPSEFPPQQTCYIKLLAWQKDGRLEQVEQLLNISGRQNLRVRNQGANGL